MRRTWQFRSVYLTISSGVQQRANTLKQEKGIPRFMSSMKHFRNFALSKVKNSFLKVLLGTDFTFWSVCLHWKGLILLLLHYIDLTLSLNCSYLYHYSTVCIISFRFLYIVRICTSVLCDKVLWLRQTDIDVLTELYCVISAITSFGSLLGFAWKWQ